MFFFKAGSTPAPKMRNLLILPGRAYLWQNHPLNISWPCKPVFLTSQDAIPREKPQSRMNPSNQFRCYCVCAISKCLRITENYMAPLAKHVRSRERRTCNAKAGVFRQLPLPALDLSWRHSHSNSSPSPNRQRKYRTPQSPYMNSSSLVVRILL